MLKPTPAALYPEALLPVTFTDLAPARHLEHLPAGEALRLLGGVALGRIVFTQSALPAIRPVNHVVDQGAIVIRSHAGAALISALGSGGDQGTVVAYEADCLDLHTRTGWSVIVTGYAQVVTSPDDLQRYARLLHPWTDHSMDHAIRIQPEIVTGFRLRPPGDQLPTV